jgi:hypothetical protein
MILSDLPGPVHPSTTLDTFFHRNCSLLEIAQFFMDTPLKPAQDLLTFFLNGELVYHCNLGFQDAP